VEKEASSAPNVSVVIPLGGVDDLLRPQLVAVLGQVLDESFEVVLSLNTPSADVRVRLDALIEELADRRLRVVDSSDARGAAHARNVGGRAAVGDRLAFCDGDDLVHPGWLAGLVRGLSEFQAVTGRVIDVFVDPGMAAWHPPATDGGLPRFLGVPYLLSGHMAIHRAWFDKVGGFDETLTRCEDIAIGWSLIRAGAALGYVDDSLLDYRHRPGIRPMLKQHYLYGRGMAEVLGRDGVPSEGGWSAPGGLRMLKPNGQRVAKRTVVGTMRRGALAAGRVRGIVQLRVDRRSKGAGR
jgi:glycosyltransferase involved in cell wall biosynthesis